MRKYVPHLGRMLNSNERGAILILLIFILVAAGIFGSSMVYLTTSSTYDELLANNQARAYYLAEAGGRYVIPKMLDFDTAAFFDNDDPKTVPFTLSNGEKFVISNMTKSSEGERSVTSTGIVNEGSWLEGKRNLIYGFVNPSFNYDPDVEFDDFWDILCDDLVTILNDSEKTDGEPAVRFKQMGDDYQTTIALKWEENDAIPDLEAFRNDWGGLLSYQLSIQIKMSITGNDARHFMIGISFRLDGPDCDPLEDSSYGISFFKSDDSHQARSVIPWYDLFDCSFDVLFPSEGEGCPGCATCTDGIDNDDDDLIDLVSGLEDPDCDATVNPVCDSSTFCTDGIDNDNDGLIDGADPDCSPSHRVYIILWRKESGGEFTLLDYHPLTPDDPVICTGPSGPHVGEDILCDWSTIAVTVLENFDDEDNRVNTISGYFQGTGEDNPDPPPDCSIYCRNTVNWDFDNVLIPAVWNDITDPELTSAGFDDTPPLPKEIGIHCFYDKKSNNDVFVDNFTMRLVSPDGNVFITPQQWGIKTHKMFYASKYAALP